MPFWTVFWLIVPAVVLLATATWLYRRADFSGFREDDGEH